jgi:hypothetical protein
MVGMAAIPRLYAALLAAHLRDHRQMALVSGPRQVGKTTTCRELASAYLDWDNAEHRRVILAGPAQVAERLGLARLAEKPVVATIDEVHKYRGWRGFLKGLYDTYSDRVRVLVTGSSRLDIYRRGGDSLMGRHFRFRMHPLSIAEVLHSDPPGDAVVRAPSAIPDVEYRTLLEHGGFPEPFVKRDPKFTRRWQGLRNEQLMRQDVRDLTRIQELGQLEVLANLLAERSGSQIVYGNLSGEIGASVDTVRRWIETLAGLHFAFLVRPWFRNLGRALRKEPKIYLRDWSLVGDPGARAETFVACHLLKAVEGWTDLGLGRFDLHYLRDKEKREVDFLVVRDRRPWFLVEAKASDTSLSPALARYQKATGCAHAFQAVMDLAPIRADCFSRHDPVVVPARTLLSQFL